MKPIQVKTRHYAGQDEFIHIIDRNIDGEYLVIVDAHDGCYTEILSEAQISDNWGIELSDGVKKTSELVSIWLPVIPIDPTHDGFILTEDDGEHRNYTKVVGQEIYSLGFWGNDCLVMVQLEGSPEWDTLFQGKIPNQYAFQMILKMIGL